MLFLFFEDSNGKRHIEACPDIPEAPLTSLLHHRFSLGSLVIRKSPGRAEFVHPESNEVLVVASLTLVEGKAVPEFDIRESEIRSYEVFKPVRFPAVLPGAVRGGCNLGLRNRSAEVACNFTPEEMAEVLNG